VGRERPLRLAANGSEAVRLTLPRLLHRRLERRRRLALRLTAIVRDPAGNVRTVRRQVGVRR
jgi:hypothetical protein